MSRCAPFKISVNYCLLYISDDIIIILHTCTHGRSLVPWTMHVGLIVTRLIVKGSGVKIIKFLSFRECKRCSQNSGPWLRMHGKGQRYFGDLHDYLPHYLQPHPIGAN